MTLEQFLQQQNEETRLIIDEMTEAGADPDELYTIEHHISTSDFNALEKMAVEAFKLGYEVTDPEEIEVERDQILFCCDIFSEIPLDAELIDEQVEQLVLLANKYDINYDGWGTFFEGEGDEDDEDEDDDYEDDDMDQDDYDEDEYDENY